MLQTQLICLKNGDKEIVIWKSEEGRVFINCSGGEGGEFSEAQLFDAVMKFYNEKF